MNKSKTAILGFGNPIISDDAVGCYVIDELTAFFMYSQEVTLFDMGTSDKDILCKLKGHNTIILIDGSFNSGESPGTIFRLSPEEIASASLEEPKVMLPCLRWHHALYHARKVLGEGFPERVIVYLIAVDDTQLDIGLTEEVAEAGDQVVKLIRRTIMEVGV